MLKTIWQPVAVLCTYLNFAHAKFFVFDIFNFLIVYINCIKRRIRMIKRKISLMLAVVMVLTLMMPIFAFGADYSGHWAEDTIAQWFKDDLLKGYEDGSFKPDAQITRAEFMTMVNNAFDFTEKAEIGFRDVKSSDWYYQEVQKAAEAGYIIGYEDNTIRPVNKITRQEAALIIARIKALNENALGAKKFVDYNEIASWAIGGVGAAAQEKYMMGYEDYTFRPLRFISRAEALVTIDRALDMVVEVPGTGGGNTGGSNSGGGNSGGDTEVTTSAAILASLSITDETSTRSIDITTPSAISGITTTSSAITITAIAAEGTDITIRVVTPSGISVTTSSAINGIAANIPLDTPGIDYYIEIVATRQDERYIDYLDTVYTVVVTRILEP